MYSIPYFPVVGNTQFKIHYRKLRISTYFFSCTLNGLWFIMISIRQLYAAWRRFVTDEKTARSVCGAGSPVFRRSTRKVPSFSSRHFFISFPASRFFLYLQQIFNALLGLFLLKKFFWYVIIIVLYSTLFGGRLWHTILRKENKKKGTYLQMYESHWDKEKKQSMGIF